MGDEHLCTAPRFLGVNRDGGYADYVLVPHPRYLVEIGDLDPVAAAPLVCSGLTTYSALKKFGPLLARQPIAIIGAGGLGLIALGVLKMLGGKGAVVVEIDPRKREAALAAGALATVDPKAPDAAAQLRQALGGSVLGVLDLVGSGDTATLGVETLDTGGRLVIVGLFGGAMTLAVPLVPMKALTIQAAISAAPPNCANWWRWCAEHGMPATPIDRRPPGAGGRSARRSAPRQGRRSSCSCPESATMPLHPFIDAMLKQLAAAGRPPSRPVRRQRAAPSLRLPARPGRGRRSDRSHSWRCRRATARSTPC